jgi:hypothetical protein
MRGSASFAEVTGKSIGEWNIFLFVCLFAYSHTSNISAIWRLSPLPVTGLQSLAYAQRSGPLSRGDLYRATPTATWDIGLYGLIRKTGTLVPRWDSNPRRKDQQIIALDTLTTAPCRRFVTPYLLSLREAK